MSANKPTVYLDANILSVLHYNGGSGVALLRQTITRDWWALERPLFHVWTSRIAVLELKMDAIVASRKP